MMGQFESTGRRRFALSYPTCPCRARVRPAWACHVAAGVPGCSDRRKPFAVVRRALELRSVGHSTKAIARELGQPRSTVRYWFGRFAGVAQLAEATDLKSVQWGFESLHQHQYPAYAYLLGVYLGDGYIYRMPRTYVLRIFLHREQREIGERVKRAISKLLPAHRVGRVRHHEGAVAITCYFNHWPALFPQHGPGRKHSRRIELEGWQREIVTRHPVEFLRGLIESDGCRHRRVVRGRDYPAYSFKNHSQDIHGLFGWACDLLEIRYRRSSMTTISIARRADVARLDALMAHETVPAPATPSAADGSSSWSLRPSTAS